MVVIHCKTSSMTPSSPVFPNLENYGRRSSSGTNQTVKSPLDSPLVNSSKGGKKKCGEINDGEAKNVGIENDLTLPHGQNLTNTYQPGTNYMDINEESDHELISKSDNPFENPSEDSEEEAPLISPVKRRISGNPSRGFVSEDDQPYLPRLKRPATFQKVTENRDEGSEPFQVASSRAVKDADESNAISHTTTLSKCKQTATLRPKRVRKKPNMLKELQLHNEEFPEVRTSSAPVGFDVSEVHLTRRQATILDSMGPGEENSPTQALEPESPTTLLTKRTLRSPSPPLPASSLGKRQRKHFQPLAMKSRLTDAKLWQMKKKKHGMLAWETWQERKGKITGLLQSPYYSPSTAQNVQQVSGQLAESAGSLGLPESLKPHSQSVLSDSQVLLDTLGENQRNSPQGFDFEVIDGVYVFKPTTKEILDFENFLATVEEIAGREMGVVKVIVPKKLLVSYNGNMDQSAGKYHENSLGAFNSSRDPIVRVNLTMLSLRNAESKGQEIYDVRIMGGLNKLASKVMDEIRDFREPLAKHCAGKGKGYAEDFDIYKEVEYAAIYGKEDDMISNYGQNQSIDLYYGVSEVTEALRNSLQCNRIDLRVFRSSEFDQSSISTEKVNKPMFHMAGLFGSTLGLQTTDLAAYNLNILHHGAPKCWTIVEPVDHVKVEEKFHPDCESAGGRECRFRLETGAHKGAPNSAERAEERLVNRTLKDRPCDIPPRCDQFMAHQPFYIPEDTLSSNKLRFRKFVQHQGEMIIIFPFAYYQVYSTGNSLAEAIDYTNDRSETFTKNHLYHPCHHDCTGLRDKDDWVGYMARLQPVPVPTRGGPNYMPTNSFPHAQSSFQVGETSSGNALRR